ncbi:MAG: hypothetical protein K5675_09980 [Lachnospiraceae bacterium]|nr:hypothetical protein [Lachnospiraceae bacterium]
MGELKWKTIGDSSFLVYELKEKETIDELAKGMLENNDISVALSFTFSQLDDIKELIFDTSGVQKVSVDSVDSEKEQKDKENLEETLKTYCLKHPNITVPQDCRFKNEAGEEVFVVLPVMTEQVARVRAYEEKL